MLQLSYKLIRPVMVFALTGVLAVLSGCSTGSLMQSKTSGGAEQTLVKAPAGVQRDYQKALKAFQAGDLDVAELRFRNFVQAHPEYANAYVNLAILLDQRGVTDEAVNLLESAVDVDPQNVFALNRLGLIKRQQGDFAAAEQAWLELTRVAPDYANAWYNLGVLYDLYLQDWSAAVGHYQRYQDLSATADAAEGAGVQRWIADLQRRIGDEPKTASATETM